MDQTVPKKTAKRCPACGSRVALAEQSCPVCGYEFSSTAPNKNQASAPQPVAKPIAQPARQDVPYEDSSGPAQPPTPIPASDIKPNRLAAGGTINNKLSASGRKVYRPVTEVLQEKQRQAIRVPWGVVGVLAVVLGILGGAVWLTRDKTAGGSPNAPATLEISSSVNGTIMPTTGPVESTPAAPTVDAGTPSPDGAVGAAETVAAPATVDPQATATEAAVGSPTPLPPPPMTATPPPPVDYVIVSGDTCGSIAEKYGIRLSVLLAANNLTEATCPTIRIGDKLKVPVPSPTPGASAVPSSDTATPLPASAPPAGTAAAGATAVATTDQFYEVKAGDVCGTVAEKTGVKVDELIRLNQLDSRCLIRPGQKLLLRVASAAPDVPTATPIAAGATPTPRAGYAGPQLLSPFEGTVITDGQSVVTLQWLSVGLLKPNEYYVIQVQPSGAITVPVFETKATEMRIDRSLLGAEAERSFVWFVQVKQKLAVDPKTNAPIYNPVSPQSEQRRFIWKQQLATPTPAG